MFQYYGIDLLATAFTFLGIYQVGNKKRSGFVISAVGNLLWIFIGLWGAAVGLVIANIGIVWLNTRGYLHWSSQEK